MLNPSLILLFIISFLDLALGFFVFVKNPKERINQSFALFTLVGLIWINASFFEDELKGIGFKYFLMKLDFATGIFAAFFLLLFCLDVSKSVIADRLFIRRSLVVIPLLLSAMIFLSKLIIAGYGVSDGVISPVYGGAYVIYDLLVGAALAAGVGTLLRKYRRSSNEDKAKFIYLFIGFLLTSSVAFATNIALADFIKNSPHYGLYSRFGLFSSIFVILFSGYAIVKHHLLNLKVIATELLSLGILVLALLQTLKSENLSTLITNGIIFAVLLVFVIMLVRSVELEVKRKDELQLLYNQLAVANNKLRELDQARAEFMSMASHQLQTPLTAVKGFSSLLLEKTEGDLTASQEDMIRKISLSSERMVQLIKDYLNLSRIESGKLEYTFEKCHLEDICQEVVDTLALPAKAKNLYLKYERSAALPGVTIDGPKVREVISNLVDNAIKYTPEGGVTVSADPRKNARGESVIRINVSDTGMGIAPSDIPKLFAKFARIKDEQHLKVTGTGLGLYVGKVMIEANGGRIWAESDGVGKGTRFIVEIPVEHVIPQVNSGWGGSV